MECHHPATATATNEQRGDYYPVERIEMFNLRYCNTPDFPKDMFTAGVLYNNRVDDYKNPVDVLSSVIYLSDGLRYREIYNPVKLKRFYTTVPPMQPPFSHDDEEEEEMRSEQKSRGEFTELPLMCTNADADISPFNFFHVIVHDNDSPFKMPYSSNDVTALWKPQSVTQFYDTLVPFKFSGSFGTVELDFILFSDSKLVKVSVEWLLEEGIGGDGKRSLATTETTYICGELLLFDCKFETSSVLLLTPEGKGVKLEQDNSIPLLKSVVAIPYYSSFNVVANLRDPITHSNVKGNAFFHFDDFPKENRHLESVQEIDGYGAKIKVKVVMEAPDRDFDITFL